MTESTESTETTTVADAVPPMPFKPVVPKLGGINEVGTNSWAAWTGGEPLADWSGLKDKPAAISPNQYRSTSITGQAKSKHYRVQGLETKFGRDDDLLTLQRKVMKHLVEHGLDTITYMVDPTDSTKVISVINEHAKFNLKQGIKDSNAMLVDETFDSYDLSNVRDAREYLFNSIDSDLENQLYESCQEDDSFVSCWLNLIHIIRTVSIERFDKIKDRIKARKISNYAGENIELLSTDFLSDWKELHGAGLYDQNLTMTMLNTIMEAGGNVNEDFRHPLRTLKMKLNDKLLEVRHLTYTEAHNVMVKEALDVKSVLKSAKDEYRTLHDDGKWPASSNAKDSKAMNKTYGNVNMTATTELRNLVNALVQQGGGNGIRDKSKDTCNNCNQKGHWARDCPKLKKRSNGNPRTSSSRQKSTQNNPHRNGSRGGGTSLRTPPPKTGEAEIKFTNGKKTYWCAKCNRWTLSHGTDGHKSKEEMHQQTSAHVARVDFDLHPSAFMLMRPTIPHDGFPWWTLALALIGLSLSLATMFVLAPVLLNNLVWLILTLGSGAIGSGSAAYLFTLMNSIDATTQDRNCFCNSANVRKQYRRRSKPRKTGRRHQGSIPSRIPAILELDRAKSLNMYHNRFNNISRNNRYEPPNVARICAVQNTIRDLRVRIKTAELELDRMRHDLDHQRRALRKLEENAKETAKFWDMNNLRSLKSKLVCLMIKLTSRPIVTSANSDATETQLVLFDSGANCCITNRRSNFIGEFEETRGNQSVDGIGKGLRIFGHGTVAWTFKTDDESYRTLKVPCYYVPSSTARILSVQVVLKHYPTETVKMDENKMVMSGDINEASITVPYCTTSNLPIAPTVEVPPQANKAKKDKPTMTIRKHPSLTSTHNINLSEPEKELLRWHHRLGHIGMKRVQWLFRQGILSTSEQTRRLHTLACKLTHGPLCTACQYAKQRRKSKPGLVQRIQQDQASILKADNLFPGSRISVDHFECNPLGRLLDTYGKERIDAKYKGGCIFVDHATGYIDVQLQTKFNSHETLASKIKYEEFCGIHGVIPQTYISDEGTSFVSQDFTQHLSEFHQTLRTTAPGGHHSNGIAERNIGSIMSISRAMLHHSALHWPDVADVELWPLALLHAVHLINRIPREDCGQSPLELFSRKTWATSKFHDFHVWGCPVYVLVPDLQNGRRIPRWRPRSTRSVYVGNSTRQGQAIPLVLNLDTGKITGQYHVIFDNWFQTVKATDDNKANFEHDDWYKTFGLTPSQYIPDDDDEENEHNPSAKAEGVSQRELSRSVQDRVRTPQPLIITEPNQRETSLRPASDPPLQALPTPRQPDLLSAPHPAASFGSPPPLRMLNPDSVPSATPVSTTSIPPAPLLQEVVSSEPVPTSPLQRENSPKESSPKRHKVGSQNIEPPPHRPVTRSQTEPCCSSRTTPSIYRKSARYSVGPPLFHAQTGRRPPDAFFQSPHAFKTTKCNTDPDTYSWDQAMKSPLRDQFLLAAQEEIEALVEKGTWYKDLKSNATEQIIPSQWVFRIKRFSDGLVKKIKGRIVLRGDQLADTGVSYYSPVAAWCTVRTFLTIAHIRGWITTTIDFSNAFVQSALPDNEPVWMQIPRGYASTLGNEYCLKLVKSLYGHKRAPQLWYNHSSDAFRTLSLRQSEHDKCLWYGDDIMVVQYVDDCGIAGPTQGRIDQFVQDLRGLEFELTQEGSFEEFLGIKFDTLPSGAIECTQKGLIKKTLEAAGMEDCNPNSTPAAQTALGADKDGEPMNKSWNYRAICGMLLYLSTNTRPDIAFAVSQVCRFSLEPKASHATAVKTILRYLKKTKDKGLIVNPTVNSFHFDLFVDADMAGLFGREDPRDPNSVRSRTGYIILLSGWPLIWKSQLQTHISQSTLEAEYSALSASLKVFLPLRRLIEEMISNTQCKPLEDVRLHANVFEDNQSTYFLATNQQITSRTKYLLTKWHWFWDEYNKGHFKIIKCPTEAQKADFLTKSPPKATFESNRLSVQGW